MLLDKTLSTFGILQGKKMWIYKILASILLLGNIGFHDNVEEDKCHISPDTQIYLKYAADLMDLDAHKLEHALLNRVVQVKGSEPLVYVDINSAFIHEL